MAKASYHKEHVTVILPAGSLYHRPRLMFEVDEFCCDGMQAAWDKGLITFGETPTLAISRGEDGYAPISFCPFCGDGIDVEPS